MAVTYVPIDLNFQNLAADYNAEIRLNVNNVEWSLGQAFTEAGGLELEVSGGKPIPLGQLTINPSVLNISTMSSSGGGSGSAINFDLRVYLAVNDGATSLRGDAILNPECQITVSVDNQSSSTWSNGQISAAWGTK